MCTVSVVPHADGVRVVCNRDERLTRAPALPPVRRRCGDLDAVFAVDPASDGTWIGGNQAGLVAALLNRTVDGSTPPPGRLSRGAIVPLLLRCQSIGEACDELQRIGWRAYAACRILLADATSVVTFTPGDRSAVARSASEPAMLTSSSLGDDLVCGPRNALFDSLVRHAPDMIVGQRAFHDHRWQDCPHLSVRMRRADAATVSRTRIDINTNGIDLRYEPLC